MGSANKASEQKYKPDLILFQITNSTTQNVFGSELFYVILGALIGSFISFFLFAAWDERKDSKSNQAERARVLSLLAIESAENIIRRRRLRGHYARNP